MRLDRLLANTGYGSRKQVQAVVRGGRVRVDGGVVTDAAQQVDPDRVTLDGAALEAPRGLLAALHKPVGVVCSHSDREGPRIYELVPEQWMRRNPTPTTIGRLDKDSSGLVLVTDQMPLVHTLASPRRHVAKRYEVQLDRVPDAFELRDLMTLFASGRLQLRGETSPCLPAELRVLLAPVGEAGMEALEAVAPTFEVTITEGRHRQVRRMFAAAGFEVVALHRTQVGDYLLGDLAPGQWRLLPLPPLPNGA